MATTGVGIRESFIAETDLSAKQWHFVKASSAAGYVEAATGGSGPWPIGILENDPKAGEEATVCLFGVTKVAASGAATTGAAGAIAMGNYLSAGSHAKALKDSTCVMNAMALEALGSGAGGTITVFLFAPGGRNVVGS